MAGIDGLRMLERVTAEGSGGASSDPTSRGRLTALIGGALLAAAAAAGVALLQRSAIPDEALLIPGQRAKLEDLAARGREFDLVFFGSSHLYRGIDPDAVDRRLAELGRPMRSYNGAFAAGFSFETDATLRRVVTELTGPTPDGAPQRLRWVVVEFPDWSPEARNLNTLRTVAWHDATQTRNVFRALTAGGRRWRELDAVMEHGRLFFTRLLGMGFGPAWFEETRGSDRGGVARLLPGVSAGRGFAPFGVAGGDDLGAEPDEDVPAVTRHAEFLANVAQYEAEVAALREGRGKGKGLKVYPTAALRAQLDFLAARGVNVAYVVAPVPWKVSHADRLAKNGGIPALLSFNDPAQHSELFRVENRFDRGHVNEAGAAAFSRAFADAFADLLAKEPRRR